MAVAFWRLCRIAAVLSMEKRRLEPDRRLVLAGKVNDIAVDGLDSWHLDEAEQRRVKSLKANGRPDTAGPDAGGRGQRQFIRGADLHLGQSNPLGGPFAPLLRWNEFTINSAVGQQTEEPIARVFHGHQRFRE